MQMSPKPLLINCITLLCLENLPNVHTASSHDLVGEILDVLPLPEGTLDNDHSRQIVLDLRNIVNWLMETTGKDFPPLLEIQQQMRVACREEEHLFNAFGSVFDKTLEEEEAVKLIQSYRNQLYKYLNEDRIRQTMKDYYAKLAFNKGQANAIDIVRELSEKLEPLISKRGTTEHHAVSHVIDFNDIENLQESFTEAIVSLSSEGGFKPGWKALARMLGKHGCFRRGEYVSNAAVPHNFKSGWLLCLLVHFCLFNTPFMRDRTKKPLILFLSLENSSYNNLMDIYKYIKENKTGEAVVDSEIDFAEAAAYVHKELQASGFNVVMKRIDPTEFTSADLINELDAWSAKGYEVQALFVDYLNMLSKKGIEAFVFGDEIKNLFKRVRNYCAPRGITCLTPHQLSADAIKLLRDNPDDFTKTVANRGFYDGCSRLGQEMDLEIFHHIIEVHDAKGLRKYLDVHRGKHRGVVTSSKHHHFLLPFSDVGTIPWDIDKDTEITCSVAGEIAGEEASETVWW